MSEQSISIAFNDNTLSELSRISVARHMTIPQLVVEIIEADLFGKKRHSIPMISHMLSFNTVCLFCKKDITADYDKDNILDWLANGDYGCDAHPLSDDGVWGHAPKSEAGVALTDLSAMLWRDYHNTDAYVTKLEELATRMRIY